MGEQRCSSTHFWPQHLTALCQIKTWCILIEAKGTKIQFNIFRNDKIVFVRQEDETGIFSFVP